MLMCTLTACPHYCNSSNFSVWLLGQRTRCKRGSA